MEFRLTKSLYLPANSVSEVTNCPTNLIIWKLLDYTKNSELPKLFEKITTTSVIVKEKFVRIFAERSSLYSWIVGSLKWNKTLVTIPDLILRIMKVK